MGKYRYKLKRRTNRRGGFIHHSISSTVDVDDWEEGVRRTQPIVRKAVAVGDMVDVRSAHPYESTQASGTWERYTSVMVTRAPNPEYLEGVVCGDGWGEGGHTRCNICGRWGGDENKKEGEFLYACKGDIMNACDFHCCKKCIRYCDKSNKSCDCKLERIDWQCGKKLFFKRNRVAQVYDSNPYAVCVGPRDRGGFM